MLLPLYQLIGKRVLYNTNLCPIGQCDLTFKLGEKQFTVRFIILQDVLRIFSSGLIGNVTTE